jgi:hypothetical protein
MRRTSRTPRHLPYSIHQQLNMYALAASAVGVGLLALAQPAGAKIVYTPTKVQLITGQDIYVDLDHDGTNDFYFVGQQSQKTSSGFAFLAISPQLGMDGWNFSLRLVEETWLALCRAEVPHPREDSLRMGTGESCVVSTLCRYPHWVRLRDHPR